MWCGLALIPSLYSSRYGPLDPSNALSHLSAIVGTLSTVPVTVIAIVYFIASGLGWTLTIFVAIVGPFRLLYALARWGWLGWDRSIAAVLDPVVESSFLGIDLLARCRVLLPGSPETHRLRTAPPPGRPPLLRLPGSGDQPALRRRGRCGVGLSQRGMDLQALPPVAQG